MRFYSGHENVSERLLLLGVRVMYLIVADQPDPWGLVVLVVRDHHVVCSHLQ